VVLNSSGKPWVYVAGAYRDKARAAAVAATLRRHGVGVTSAWHDRPDEGVPEADMSRALRAAIAWVNRNELTDADTLVLLVHPNARGSLREHGFALGRGLHTIVVGDRAAVPSLMVEQPECAWAESIDDLVRMLAPAEVSNG
jgi:nucleoside 2-deoxyribosyltransferase